MDELDALRRMRTALAEEEHPDRIALRTNWRAGVPDRPRRSFKIPMMGVAATAAAAAVAAGVLVAVQPDDGSAPARKAPAAPQGNVLLAAATSALKAPNGKYWHTKTVSGEVYAVGKSRADHYKVDSRQGSEAWTERNGKGRSTHIEYADVPLTAQDRKKWEAAGSPKWVRIPDPDGAADEVFLDMSEASAGGPPHWMPADDQYYGMTPQRIAALPTEPKALENALLDLNGDWHAYAPDGDKEPMRALRGRERIRALTDVAGTLLSTAPSPPAVRAAAFRMLAAQPGVKAEGKAADPMGRTGAVVSLPLETTTPLGLFTAPKQLGTYRRQWIIDPANGTLLAIRDLVAKPPHGSRPLPPGDNGRPRSLKAANMPDRFHRPGELASYQVFEVSEWTNAEPRP